MSSGGSPVELELPVESDNPASTNHFTADKGDCDFQWACLNPVTNRSQV
jgi:hypothetical protein